MTEKNHKGNVPVSRAMRRIAITLSIIAILLIVTSFFVPPTGVVDGSVLAAVGEIFAFVALFFAWEAIDRGIDAKIKHGDTVIVLDGDGDGKMGE